VCGQEKVRISGFRDHPVHLVLIRMHLSTRPSKIAQVICFGRYLDTNIFPLGLGLFYETFRFISVTRFRTVSRTHWTGDQLVARPLRICPG
jgi:hypothetical protein